MIVGSEWYGNPLLFAVENLFIRQANVFLDHIEETSANWNYWAVRHTARYLARFRIPGPDAAVIVRQRIAGHYGHALQLYQGQHAHVPQEENTRKDQNANGDHNGA